MNKVVVEIDKVKNPYSGLGQFCINLGKELITQQPSNIDLEFAITKKVDHPFSDFGNFHLIKPMHRYFVHRPGEKTVWHATHQDSPYLPEKGTKLVLTIHDLNFLEKYTNSIRHKWRLRLIQKKIDRASVITTISEFSANHIKEYLNTRDLPVHVIHNGCILPSGPPTTPMQPVKGNFLFTIGIIQLRKNLESLIHLMKILPDFKLVIAGSAQPKHGEYLKGLVDQMGLHNRIIFTGAITDSEKWWYYNNCRALVFPSRSEGFGLPVIEAMHCGKPAFLSTFTCLPEIGGNNAFYWDNFEPELMKKILLDGLSNWTPLREQAAKRWAADFSWQKAAQQYWQIYKDLL